jgi:hypothetical protein
MFSNSGFSSNQITKQYSFFKLGLSELIREVLLFSPQPASELSVTNSAFSDAINSIAYWKQCLKRDFGMPWHYSNLIIDGKEEEKHPFIALRTVYHRLARLKKQDPDGYKHFYKNIIIDGYINFPPLLATGPSYPAIEKSMLAFYFHESVNLGNTRLAEHILLQIFPKISEEKEDLSLQTDFVTTSAIEIATETDNHELLQRMRPYAALHNNEYTCRKIDLILKSDDAFDSNAKDTSNAEKAICANHILNLAIGNYQHNFASNLIDKLSKNSMALHEQTLASALLSNNGTASYWRLIFKLLSLIPEHPQLLHLSPASRHTSFERSIFPQFLDALSRKADIKLMKKISALASLLPTIFNPEHLQKIQICLLEVAIICGDFASIKSSQQQLRHTDAEYLMCIAIQHGRLKMMKYFIQQLDKETRDFSNKTQWTIKCCCHKKIIKYLIEEFKPSFKPIQEEKPTNQSDQICLLNIAFSNAPREYKWLDGMIRTKNIDLFIYFTKEAPKDCRLTFDTATLGSAIHFDAVVIVRYLVEICGIKVDCTHARQAIRCNNPELAVYLLDLCLNNINPSEFSPAELIKVMRQMREPNEDVNKLLDWLTSPQGIERGFQFTLSHLIKDLKNEKFSFQMLAWLSARLKIEIPPSTLELISKATHSSLDFVYMNLPTNIGEQVKLSKKNICLDALTSLYHKFRCELNSDSTSTSSAPMRYKK